MAERCPKCGGSGVWRVVKQPWHVPAVPTCIPPINPHTVETIETDCSQCGGSGRIANG